MPDQEQVKDNPNKDKEQSVEPAKAAKQRSVVNCNFRSAGRLSNENARSLTAIHETFARYLGNALDTYVGTTLEVKLKGLEQIPIREHTAGIPALSYCAPLSLSATGTSMILGCDVEMVFALIELLLGGVTGPLRGSIRELSEIEEEIMHDVATVIARQAESAFHMENHSLTAGRHIKTSVLHQYCQPNEKVMVAKFEIELSGITAMLQLVFPVAFLNVLIQQIKRDQPMKKGALRYFPQPDIRERMLDCDVEVAAELGSLRVAVRDLIALEPGSVLKLRAPVRNPGMLTVGGQGIFEAVPVRNGLQKAAQLGRRMTPGLGRG
jgi:flagellar motor switch protein FliM